ncbi:MAG: deoxyribose-phosphate aldolase [Actinomycetota bacterium]
MTDEASLARRALALIDLTDLNDGCTDDDVRRLCARAITPFGPVAAVCVWPRFVRTAKHELASTAVKVATVVDFPSGDEPIDQVVATTARAIADGADEIDVVLPYRALLAGDEERVVAMLRAVRAAVPAPRHLKVILETGELVGLDHVERAARLAIDHGADFVKTSTGKSKVSATPDAVRVMLQVIAMSGRSIGIKPSGGIRTVADAAVYLRLADEIMGADWATPDTFRFGASGLLDAVLAAIDHS